MASPKPVNFLPKSVERPLNRATARFEPPFAVIDLDAFDANAADLMRRSGGVPLRLASKSLRVRALQERALAAGFRGVLCFTLPEALWLAGLGWEDLVVGYPTMDRAALAELAGGPARERVTGMADCVEHLDAIASGPVKVCLDADAGWRALGGRLQVGAKRSPLHTPAEVAALAREIAARPHLVLDGLMAYEGQIAGVGDRPPGKPLLGLAVRGMQALSARELARRDRGRAAAAALRQRRRHRLDRAHRRRGRRHRGGRRLGPLRAHAVRRLPRVPPPAGGV